MGDDVFQLDELVNPYWVALSTNLDEILNFVIAKNIFIDVDFEELNDILTTIGHIKVDEDDDIDEQRFNVEDYGGHDDNEIEKKKIQFELIYKTPTL